MTGPVRGWHDGVLSLELPWPPAALSPNARLNWRRVSKAKKRYRHCCWGTVREAIVIGTFRGAPMFGGLALVTCELKVELEFVRPSWREHDEDNLVASMKAGLDGLADALQVNDRQFHIVPSISQTEVGGFVRVRISQL